MKSDNVELSEKEHKKEYYNNIYSDKVDLTEFISKPIKKIAVTDLEIPDIGSEKTTDPITNVSEKPVGTPIEDMPNENNTKFLDRLTKLEKILEESKLDLKLQNIKDDIYNEVGKIVRDLKNDVDSLRDKQVPKRKQYDTGGAYKEQLYNIVTKVLDESLLHLFEDIPDYHLIANQITKLFDDGTVENGIMTVGITLNNDGYRYDFKVDVPILNGLINSPLYIQRGIKIIPLTRDAIESELESLSFRKLNIEDNRGRENLYNNIGENFNRKQDTQKWYETYGQNPEATGLSEKSKWVTNKNIRGKNI